MRSFGDLLPATTTGVSGCTTSVAPDRAVATPFAFRARTSTRSVKYTSPKRTP
jgi:hypothetical protein